MMSATLHVSENTLIQVDDNHLSVGGQYGDHVQIFATPEQLLQIAHAILDKHESKLDGYEQLEFNAEHSTEIEGRYRNAG